jgi:hypothetical protein
MSDKSVQMADFVAITAVESEQEAQYWLEASQWDVSAAVELFFSSGGNSIGPVATTARQKAIEENKSAGRSADFDDDYVRKPDEVKRQRLLDTGLHMRMPISAKQVVSTFSSGAHLHASDKEVRLSTMYRPPHDLIVKADFANARELCKTEGKWLLVNIQSEAEFKCHQLNRDVWNDDFIQEAIRSSCLFWQQQEHSNEGAIYVERYKVSKYPHVAIIDPRTGALIWNYEGKINSESFGERFMDFLGSHPYPEQPYAAPRRSISTSASIPGSSSSMDGGFSSNPSASFSDSLFASDSYDANGSTGGGDGDDDSDFAKAIRASLEEQKNSSGGGVGDLKDTGKKRSISEVEWVPKPGSEVASSVPPLPPPLAAAARSSTSSSTCSTGTGRTLLDSISLSTSLSQSETDGFLAAEVRFSLLHTVSVLADSR